MANDPASLCCLRTDLSKPAFSCRRRLAILASLLVLTSPARTQLAPEVGYVFPAGGRVGTSVAVKLGGYDWTPDMQFFVHDSRVKLEVLGSPGELLIPPPPYWFGPRSRAVALPIPREVSARFILPPDLPPGPIRWQAANANGATATGLFMVNAGTEVVENERRHGPQTLPSLPVTVWGRLLKNEEVDHYRFIATRTGPVTCQLVARRLGANFHGVLEITDGAGRLNAEAVDTEGVDPVLTFAARSGAEYTVRVRDIDHAGDRSFVYCLTITPGPRVVAAIPPAGQPGQTRSIEFVGLGIATGAARLESVHREVTFPTGLKQPTFDYRLETPWGAAPPYTLLVSDLPEATAPQGKREVLIPIAAPGAITTCFIQHDDQHRYVFNSKKGERWGIIAEARRFGSPLDVALAIHGLDGEELARCDDLPGTTDAGLEFTAPADGAFQLAVSDLAGTGGSVSAIYRLAIRRLVDDFRLSTSPQRMNVLIGQKALWTVKVTRTPGFDAPIALKIDGLPPGINVPGNLVVPAGKAELAVPLEAAPDAPTAAGLVTVTGTARVAGKMVTHAALAPAAGSLAPRTPEENETTTLLVAITLKPPFKGEPVDKDTGRKAPRGSTFPAEVTVERVPGFQGEIVLKMAARQSYQVQGITGRDVLVPPGVNRVVYPCFMPEWLETSRTSRMAMIAVSKIPDPHGQVRYSVAGIDGMVTMTMEGALLKLSHEGNELSSRAGRPFTIRLRIARSAKLPEPVQLQLLPPEELDGMLHAEAVVLGPTQTDADFTITSTDDPRLAGELTLIIRATAIQKGNLPVISETAVPVTFSR